MADKPDWNKLKALTPFYSADQERVDALERELEARKRSQWDPYLSELTDAEYQRRFPTGRAEMTEYTPTLRESVASGLQSGFERVPTITRPQARRYAQSLVGGESSSMPFKLGAVDFLGGMGAISKAPRALELAAAPFWAEEGLHMVEESGKSAAEGDYLSAILQGALGVGAAVPAAQALNRGLVASGKVAKAAAPTAAQMASELMMKAEESGLAMPTRLYVVRPKGGQYVDYNRDGTNVGGIDRRSLARQQRNREDAEGFLETARQSAEGLPPEEQQAFLRGFEQDFRTRQNQEALGKWMQGPLLKYVKTEMGTPEDTIRRLAEEGIHHRPLQERRLLKSEADRRERLGYPAEGMATSDLAKIWETDADRALSRIQAKYLTEEGLLEDISNRYNIENPITRVGKPLPPELALTPQEREFARDWPAVSTEEARKAFLEENPWLKTVPGETNIWTMSDWTDKLGFGHVADVLREGLTTGRLTPESLKNMSVEKAIRMTHAYDVERAKAIERAAAEEARNQNVVHEFDKDYKWVKLEKPGQFSKESDLMGHSVRGYEPPPGHTEWIEGSGNKGDLDYGHGGWEGIKSGKAQVVSLRDPKNMPHTTIEFGPPKTTPDDWVNTLSNEEWDRVEKSLNLYPEPFRVITRSEAIQKLPEYQAWRSQQPQVITQVKGKSNQKPVEKYIPMVQHFIRKGNHEVVRDLEHTDFVDMGDVGEAVGTTANKSVYENPQMDSLAKSEQADAFRAEALRLRNMYDDALKTGRIPHHLTKSELQRFLDTGEFIPDEHLGFPNNWPGAQ